MAENKPTCPRCGADMVRTLTFDGFRCSCRDCDAMALRIPGYEPDGNCLIRVGDFTCVMFRREPNDARTGSVLRVVGKTDERRRGGQAR